MRSVRHTEGHRQSGMGWLRAAVLGANDGLISTASLVIGVAAANATHEAILVAGVAGLVAGTMSMAAGEYVSVHAQADSEQADLARERAELDEDRPAETRELAAIYVGRGLEPALATAVARQLMQHDALDAHAREELGIHALQGARPLQAALASAASFAVGSAVPLAIATVSPVRSLAMIVGVASLFLLAGLGATAARVGGASPWPGAWRVASWGGLAMLVTAAVGAIFGAVP